MIALSNIVRKVRMQVRDPNPPSSLSGRTSVLYADQYYLDAIDFGLDKINFDLEGTTRFPYEPPWSINTFPEQLEFILMKLAVIEMCKVRGGEDTDTIVQNSIYGGYTESIDISQISVPNLSITESAQNTDVKGPVYWFKLMRDLQEEYDNEIERFLPDVQGEITQGTLTRTNLRVGGPARYELDRGLSANTLVLTYSGGAVSASWDTTYSDFFHYYELIHEDPNSQLETLLTEYDNHETEYEETKSLASGSHRFWVNVANRNGLKTASNVVSVVVA